MCTEPCSWNLIFCKLNTQMKIRNQQNWNRSSYREIHSAITFLGKDDFRTEISKPHGFFVIFQPRINTGIFQCQYCRVRNVFFLELGFKIQKNRKIGRCKISLPQKSNKACKILLMITKKQWFILHHVVKYVQIFMFRFTLKDLIE